MSALNHSLFINGYSLNRELLIPGCLVRWRSFTNVVFDCDSTLATIEGIDELARLCGKTDEIKALTDQAMNGSIDLSEVYEKRMKLLSPTKEQIVALKQAYKNSTIEGVKPLLSMLDHININRFIVSGGLADAVEEYGLWLGFKPDSVFAVKSTYDPLAGSWWTGNTDRYMVSRSPSLTATVGKGHVVESQILSTSPGRTCLIGDGSSDLAARPSIDMFICYTGVVARPSVVEAADVVVPDYGCLAAVVLGPETLATFQDGAHKEFARASIASVTRHYDEKSFTFGDSGLEEKFFSDFERFCTSTV